MNNHESYCEKAKPTAHSTNHIVMFSNVRHKKNSSLFYLFYNFRSSKDDLNNKILLKNLLESLEMEVPDELKGLDNSSTDAQKLS